MKRWTISYAGSVVVVENHTSQIDGLVENLFADIPYSRSGTGQVTFTIKDQPDGGLILAQDGAVRFSGSDRAALAEDLMSGVCHALAVHSRGGLLFHAAGLAWQGSGILIPGGSERARAP
jgi:hypothetical protein